MNICRSGVQVCGFVYQNIYPSIIFVLNFPGRQKVKTAAQLFSHTSASAIRRCYSLGLDVYKATETADFVQLVNDWFDVLNSSMRTFSYPGKVCFKIFVINILYVYFIFTGAIRSCI